MSRKQQLKKERKNGFSPASTIAYEHLPDPIANHKLKIMLAGFIAVLAFLLYAQTISYKFSLDDGSAIVQNKLVQKGFAGIREILTTDYWYGYSDQLRGLQYRPASLVMFAIEEGLFPGNTSVHHLVNVFLYALTCLLLFLLLTKTFNTRHLLLAFITVVLFTAHPIHTEVVSNIKSRDEILCFLFGIAALFALFKYHASGNIVFLVLACLSVFLSITSKETGIAFVLVGPLVLYVSRKVSAKFLFVTTASLVVSAAVYLLIREAVVKDVRSIDLLLIDNTLVAAASKGEQFATACYILVKYVGLLFVPHPLSYDYSHAQIAIVGLGNLGAIVGILVYAVLTIFAIINIRKKNLFAFSILLFLLLLAPVSNIFLKIGSTMAERFLYMPSLGFCLFIALVLLKVAKKPLPEANRISLTQFATRAVTPLTIMLFVVTLYSFKTVSRNKDWEDNVHLFGRDVITSPNSARTHYNWGLSNVYDLYAKEEDPGLKKQYLETGKFELQRALEIYPEYFEAQKPLGYIYLKQGIMAEAVNHFDQYLAMNPTDIATLNNKAAALMGLNQFSNAIPVLEKVLIKDPSDTTAVKNLGRCYAYSNQFEKAAVYFQKSIELSPGVEENYRLTGMAYQFLGDSIRAKPYLLKAGSMNN